MSIFYNILVVVLGLLAISSGGAKLLLMPQEVEFFGAFGFSEILIIVFGLLQLVAGVLMFIPKTRIIGALMIAITFLVSAVVLALSGKTTVAITTTIFIAVAGLIVRRSMHVRKT